MAWFVDNLARTLADAGFNDLKHDVTSSDRDASTRKTFTAISVGAGCAIFRQQMRNGVEDAPTAEELEGLRKLMLEEAETGAYHRIDLHQFVAFKAA